MRFLSGKEKSSGILYGGMNSLMCGDRSSVDFVGRMSECDLLPLVLVFGS